jgi:hypothetical protein
LSKEATEEALKLVYTQIVASRKLPDPGVETQQAIIFCTGGSLSTTNVGVWRGWSDHANYQQFVIKTDHFAGTELAGKVVEIHSRLFFHSSDMTKQLISSFTTTKGNLNRAFNDRLGAPPRIARGPWPIVELKRANVYVIGTVLDFWDAFNKRDKGSDLGQLMLDWAERFFLQLRAARRHFGTDVFFLGTGVAADHPRFGEHVHLFNARLLKLIKNEQRARGSPDFPKVYFHDIYTPERHRPWRNFTKTTKSKVVIGWSDEPDVWTATVMDVLVPYMRIQCAASAQRRLASEDDKQRRDLSPDSPVAKQQKKPSYPKNSGPSSFKKRRPTNKDSTGEETVPKRAKTEARRSTSPKYRGEAVFEKKTSWRD